MEIWLTFAEDLSPSEAGTMMAVTAPQSKRFKNTIYKIEVHRRYQVNAPIMRPGKYATMDFIKSGAGLTGLYLMVMLGVLSQWVWMNPWTITQLVQPKSQALLDTSNSHQPPRQNHAYCIDIRMKIVQ